MSRKREVFSPSRGNTICDYSTMMETSLSPLPQKTIKKSVCTKPSKSPYLCGSACKGGPQCHPKPPPASVHGSRTRAQCMGPGLLMCPSRWGCGDRLIRARAPSRCCTFDGCLQGCNVAGRKGPWVALKGLGVVETGSNLKIAITVIKWSQTHFLWAILSNSYVIFRRQIKSETLPPFCFRVKTLTQSLNLGLSHLNKT